MASFGATCQYVPPLDPSRHFLDVNLSATILQNFNFLSTYLSVPIMGNRVSGKSKASRQRAISDSESKVSIHSYSKSPGSPSSASSRNRNLHSEFDSKHAAIVFTHWLYTFAPNQNVFYVDLVKMVMKYFYIHHLSDFQWDPERGRFSKGDDIWVSNEGRRFRKTKNYRASICSTLKFTNTFTDYTVNYVRWEVTLVQRPEGPMKYGLLIGCVDATQREMTRDEFIGLKEHEFALWIKDGYSPNLFTKNSYTAIHKKWNFDTKHGDRFRLEFDLRKLLCTAFFNDHEIGVLTDQLPSNICLAASAYSEDTVMETTMFEAW